MGRDVRCTPRLHADMGKRFATRETTRARRNRHRRLLRALGVHAAETASAGLR
jgi:hypothetical protein